MKNHFTTTRMVIIVMIIIITLIARVGEDMEKLAPLSIPGGNVQEHLHGKQFGGSSKKCNIEFLYDPDISLLSEYQNTEKKDSGRYLGTNVQCSIIHNSQKVAENPTVHQQMNG